MERITKTQAFALLKDPEAKWSSFKEKNGKGDYGYDETISKNGVPLIRLSVSYNPPKCEAFKL